MRKGLEKRKNKYIQKEINKRNNKSNLGLKIALGTLVAADIIGGVALYAYERANIRDALDQVTLNAAIKKEIKNLKSDKDPNQEGMSAEEKAHWALVKAFKEKAKCNYVIDDGEDKGKEVVCVGGIKDIYTTSRGVIFYAYQYLKDSHGNYERVLRKYILYPKTSRFGVSPTRLYFTEDITALLKNDNYELAYYYEKPNTNVKYDVARVIEYYKENDLILQNAEKYEIVEAQGYYSDVRKNEPFRVEAVIKYYDKWGDSHYLEFDCSTINVDLPDFAFHINKGCEHNAKICHTIIMDWEGERKKYNQNNFSAFDTVVEEEPKGEPIYVTIEEPEQEESKFKTHKFLDKFKAKIKEVEATVTDADKVPSKIAPVSKVQQIGEIPQSKTIKTDFDL